MQHVHLASGLQNQFPHDVLHELVNEHIQIQIPQRYHVELTLLCASLLNSNSTLSLASPQSWGTAPNGLKLRGREMKKKKGGGTETPPCQSIDLTNWNGSGGRKKQLGLHWPEVGSWLTLIGSHLRSTIPGVHSGAFPHSPASSWQLSTPSTCS